MIMGKTTTDFVFRFHKISDTERISEKGKTFHQVKPSKKPLGEEYKVMTDSRGIFQEGQIISEFQYRSVKGSYDIRMKDWDGHASHLGRGVYHISGPKRDLIKNFLVERKYRMNELRFSYQITGKISWTVLRDEITKMNNVAFLYVHVIGESGYDHASNELEIS